MSKWAQIAKRIRVPVGFAAAAVYLWLARPTAGSVILGSAFELAGLMVRGIASGYVRKNEVLTTSGPYAYVRNPLYLGSILLAAGFVIAARSWVILGMFAAMFVLIYLPVIRSEEQFLQQQFPEFEEYSRRVPRLLPRLRAFNNSEGGFSWDLYWSHREYNAILGAAIMIAALLAKMAWFTK